MYSGYSVNICWINVFGIKKFFCLESGYLKKFPGKHEDKWKQLPDCENVKTTQCVFPRSTFSRGIYFVRVQASNGNNTSLWSEEKRFDTEIQSKPVVFCLRYDSSIWCKFLKSFFLSELNIASSQFFSSYHPSPTY